MAELYTQFLRMHVTEHMNYELPPSIHCIVEDLINDSRETFTLFHTQHSHRRAAQRGIGAMGIMAAITLGKTIRKQQLIYHMLRRKDVPVELSSRLQDKLVHLVVITDANGCEVITCYRNSKHTRQIRKKKCRSADPFS